jgi:hypothetical protein
MAPRVERKLAAILAADVVGYSRLMQADEAGTHARLKALRQELIEPRIADHAGRIVKLTGDGALVEFSSVVEAVLAAADIQRAVTEHQASLPEAERIAFRIGINLGDVIIDEATSTATASTSRRASRVSPSPAGSASRARSTTTSATSSTSASSRQAPTGSRTSPSRSRSTASVGAVRRSDERRCRLSPGAAGPGRPRPWPSRS